MVVKQLVSILRIPLALTLAAGLGSFGCGGTDVTDFEGYGSGQPGSDLAAGGEILIERIDLFLPGVTPAPTTYATFHAYGFDSASTTAENDAKFPAGGGCTPLVDGMNWPTQVFPADAEWDDWGESITLTREDGEEWVVPKVAPPDDEDPMTPDFLTDNRPNYNRHHPFLYGGPTWQGENFLLDAWIEDTDYTVTIEGTEYQFATPPFNPEPYDIGNTTENIIIPAEGEWVAEWEVVPQAEGSSHTRYHHFAFLAFGRIDVPPGAPIALYVCPAAADGSVPVSAEVIAALPDQGIIQHGRLTHWMEPGPNGRRLDFVAIDCTIGWYQKEGTGTEQ